MKQTNISCHQGTWVLVIGTDKEVIGHNIGYDCEKEYMNSIDVGN